MDHDRAKDILRSLADGRNPATGEQFPPNSPYQQADTVRALFMAVDAIDNSARRARRQAMRQECAAVNTGSPERRPIDPNRPKLGTAWSPAEESQLREEFAARKPIPEIASTHGRTTGGITARLVKLGLIEAPTPNRAGQPPRPLPSHPPTEPAKHRDDAFPF